MTPMIDVVFQLILFFMLTSNMARPNQIELTLPESTSGVKAAEKQVLVVTCKATSGAIELRLNGTPVNGIESLGSAMQAIAEPKSQPQVDLRIDRDVPYHTFISLVDALRDSGYPKYSLLTLAPDKPAKP